MEIENDLKVACLKRDLAFFRDELHFAVNWDKAHPEAPDPFLERRIAFLRGVIIHLEKVLCCNGVTEEPTGEN